MGLECGQRLGWTVGEWRDSYWRDDSSVDWEGMPEPDRAAYLEDGDACHLRLRNGTSLPPTLIRFRALTADERGVILGIAGSGTARRAGESEEAWQARRDEVGDATFRRLLLLCFRVGVEMPDEASARPVREHGLTLLPSHLCDVLAHNYGDGLIYFYGGLVWRASSLTEDEKKRYREPGG